MTEVDIGPNTIIRTQCDTTDFKKCAVITVEPTQIIVGVGGLDKLEQNNFKAECIEAPDYGRALEHLGHIASLDNYDFPIKKTLLHLREDIPTHVQDLIDGVPDPYFEITGGSALKIDQNSLVLRGASLGGGLIDHMCAEDNSYLANRLSADAHSKVSIHKLFNNADAIENISITGKYSKDINLYGQTSIRIGPTDKKANQTLFGLDMSGTRTDIVGHWENFQAILSGNDSFINWDGNNHYESWSGT